VLNATCEAHYNGYETKANNYRFGKGGAASVRPKVQRLLIRTYSCMVPLRHGRKQARHPFKARV
jgi:hypothetical protein